MDGLEKLTETVRGEIAKVETTLKSHVSDEIATKYKETETKLAAIQVDLKKYALAGESPSAQQVTDLEKRLIEAEKNIQDFALRANTALNGSPKTEEERDIALFKGVFVKDVRSFLDRARELASLPGNAARAIDSDLFASGGKLSAETADRFIDYIIRAEAALSRVQTRRMSNPQAHIDRLTVSNRVLRKAAEGIAPTVADAIGTKRRTLTTVETIWAEDLSLNFLEDNIERRGAEAHIARILATKYGAELNDLAWNGDESENSGASNWGEINESWFGLSDATVVANDSDASHASAVSGLTTAAAVMQLMLQDLPDDYAGLSDLAYFMPRRFCQNYADEVSARQTALGDQVLVNGLAVLRYFGLPVIPERHLYNETADRGMFTSLSNLVHGIQRTITVDSMWQPRTRLVEYTITARNDYEFATPDAIVTADSIPNSLLT